MLPPGLLGRGSVASEQTQQRIDAAIRAIVMPGFEQAAAILSINRAVLERGARVLLDKEMLDETAVRALGLELQRDEAGRPDAVEGKTGTR